MPQDTRHRLVGPPDPPVSQNIRPVEKSTKDIYAGGGTINPYSDKARLLSRSLRKLNSDQGLQGIRKSLLAD